MEKFKQLEQEEEEKKEKHKLEDKQDIFWKE